MRSKINKPVFMVSTSIIILLVSFSALFQQTANNLFNGIQNNLITNAGWFYILSVALILLLCLYLTLSRYGEIKLGPDHSEPDYSNLSWFAMLFSAGMGIGLMFFGVAEPLLHFLNPPEGLPQTIDSAKEAMKITFFHWGLHAWSIYAIVALTLAYFHYRQNMPLRLSSALYPIVGKRSLGWLGNIVDIFAIIATAFGLATSLGYGVKQINAGFHYLFGIPETHLIQVILIIVVTCLASFSVGTGLDKGVKRLSELNLGLALLLLLFVLCLGPTNFLLQVFVQNVGSYLAEIVSKTFNLYAYKKSHWIGGWTLLYWCWWLSWSPFVGMFIARISRGRTIREFMLGVILIPSVFTLLWMTIFGNTAIYLLINHPHIMLAQFVDQNTSLVLFKFLEYFPFSGILSFIATLMVIVFFVTSFDSGAMVIDMIASSGNDETPIWQRIYWTFIESAIAIVLLVVGGLHALQSATIASALPFTLILLTTCYGLLKALKIEALKKQAMHNTIRMINPINDKKHLSSWHNRVDDLFNAPNAKKIKDFLKNIATPALEQIAHRLRENGLSVKVIVNEDSICLESFHGEEIDFVYCIRLRGYISPSFALSDIKYEQLSSSKKKHFRAEVFLREGSQNYDVVNYNQEQLINDVLDQYEKHLRFLELLR